MNKRIRRFSYLWLLLMMFMPLSVSAKTYKGTINIEVGETYYFDLGFGSGYTVSGYWTKTDGSAFVITSSSSGNGGCTIKGNKVGTSTLNWTGVVSGGWSTWDEEWYWTVNVAAAPVKVTKIELNKSQMTLIVNKQEQLTATIFPNNATDKSVTWSSSSESVATVSNSGNVTAKNIGNATITCKANDGSGVSASCSVTVIEQPVDPTSISIVEKLTMKLEDTYTIPYTLSPSNAATTVIWDSDNKSVATINSDGNVTPVSTGTANIVATTANGLTALCKLTVIDNIKPLKVSIDKIFTGDLYSMMLKTDESLWAWGCNTYWRLGVSGSDRLTPVKVIDGVAYVAAGSSSSTMILKTDGSLWAAGSLMNQFDTEIWQTFAPPVKLMEDVASVAVAEFHSFILKTDGSLWACGQNGDGVLGDGTTDTRTTPFKVMEGVKSVFAGYHHTMVLKNDGSLWAWGQNKYGQLGDGTTERKLTPVKIMDGGVASVAASYEHTMILKTDGTLWACGDGNHGQLGDGTTARRKTPVQVMSGVKQVSSTWLHTMILKTDGSLWACGYNEYGQLGNGTSTSFGTPTSTPVKVMDDVASVEAATYHTIMLKTDGSLWACGDNQFGQLGDGTTVPRTLPVKIAEYGVEVTDISINKTSLLLYTRQEETLAAIVKPDNATDKTVTWSSSDTSVATVNSNGKVTAVAAGSATISCKANDGSGVQAICAVTVSNPKPDTITLPTEATVTAGQALTLTPTVTPANAEYTLTWSSDDETVATVDQDGVVTGMKKGKTFINVETDNGKTAYCKLTVTAPEPTAIAIPKTATVTVGGTLTLTPTITPKDAEATLTWKSDDEMVVKVSPNGMEGLLKGIAEGLAIVTVSTSNGLTSNVCKVKVEKDPSGISTVMMDEKAGVPIYTPSGQRLAAPRKGVNIVGGKKVVVR